MTEEDYPCVVVCVENLRENRAEQTHGIECAGEEVCPDPAVAALVRTRDDGGLVGGEVEGVGGHGLAH